jgi:transposase
LPDVLNALLYIASTGCDWLKLPKDFPRLLMVDSSFTVRSFRTAWRSGSSQNHF